MGGEVVQSSQHLSSELYYISQKYIHNSGQLSVFVLETGLGLGDRAG